MIGQDKNGTWYIRVKYRDPITGTQREKKRRGFKLKREAKAAEKELIASTKASGSITFHQLADQWEDFSQTSAIMRQKHREHFEKRFGEFYDLPVDQITKQKLAKWKQDLASDDYATRTKNTTIGYVKSVFAYGHKIYDMPDPSVFLTSMKMTDEEHMQEMEVWTPAEFEQFVSAVELPIYATYFRLLYWTGMRRGEAIALQKSDLHDGWIDVHASQRNRTEGLKPTKTKARRKVLIDSKLQEELEPYRSGKGYLLGDEVGLSPSTIGRLFQEAIEASGVKKIRLHDLRHSHATWLINNGANIVAVSKRLGHASIEQTLKTYTHLLQDTDEQLIRMVEEARK